MEMRVNTMAKMRIAPQAKVPCGLVPEENEPTGRYDPCIIF
jgi:hypothetical protein